MANMHDIVRVQSPGKYQDLIGTVVAESSEKDWVVDFKDDQDHFYNHQLLVEESPYTTTDDEE